MYFKQIDGLRAIAVSMVFLYHWLPSVKFLHKFNIGPYGVSIFFVLSGFLITRILLIQKDKIKDKKQTTLKALRQFYIRRSLRIFPIYYLFIFFLFALNFETIRKEVFWHLLYGSNILYVVNGAYSNGLSHLWSLCVEEQFYLIWPLLIFLIPMRLIKPFLIFSIGLGIVSQFILINTFTNGSLLMLARIDAFGWGGLLAYLYNTNKNWKFKFKQYRFIFYFFLTFFVFLFFINIGKFGLIGNNIFHFLSFYLVAKTISGFQGKLGSFLVNPIVIFIGKISYGIYLYHNLMQWLVPYFANLLNIPFPPQSQEFFRFIIYFTITIGVSSLSWFFIEKPINKLKNKFNY